MPNAEEAQAIKPAPTYDLGPDNRATHYAPDDYRKPHVVFRVRRFWSHFGSWHTERYTLDRDDWT